MKTTEYLTKTERAALETFRTGITREFPDWTFHMTLFGSRARGDGEPESDMDILLEVEQEHVSFPEKQRLRRAANEATLRHGIVLSLLVVDRRIRRERGDFSVFASIREEGIPL